MKIRSTVLIFIHFVGQCVENVHLWRFQSRYFTVATLSLIVLYMYYRLVVIIATTKSHEKGKSLSVLFCCSWNNIFFLILKPIQVIVKFSWTTLTHIHFICSFDVIFLVNEDVRAVYVNFARSNLFSCCGPYAVDLGGGLLCPQLGTDVWTKDRRKDHKQCVPNFCQNNPFRSVFRETVPFHCLANFDYPGQWVIPLRLEWKTDPFIQN